MAKRWLAGWLLAMVCAAPAYAQTVEYIHTDALGTPVAVTDANGSVIERSEYEPYGALLNKPITDGPGYTGHVMDAATGLAYMQQRYYDPGIGRFLSVDPVTADGNSGGNFNRYWYANNNPYTNVDPDGRICDNPNASSACNGGAVAMPSLSDLRPAGELALDFTPGVGDVKGFVDAYNDPSVGNIAGAVVGLIPVGGDIAKGLIKNADNVADAASAGNKLPKPPTGPGTAAKADRDPKRFFSPSEREAKRAEQGNQCGNGCGTKIDGSNSRGHHIERHADGGKTVPGNHAEVCTDCHKKLHSGD